MPVQNSPCGELDGFTIHTVEQAENFHSKFGLPAEGSGMHRGEPVTGSSITNDSKPNIFLIFAAEITSLGGPDTLISPFRIAIKLEA